MINEHIRRMILERYREDMQEENDDDDDDDSDDSDSDAGNDGGNNNEDEVNRQINLSRWLAREPNRDLARWLGFGVEDDDDDDDDDNDDDDDDDEINDDSSDDGWGGDDDDVDDDDDSSDDDDDENDDFFQIEDETAKANIREVITILQNESKLPLLVREDLKFQVHYFLNDIKESTRVCLNHLDSEKDTKEQVETAINYFPDV